MRGRTFVFRFILYWVSPVNHIFTSCVGSLFASSAWHSTSQWVATLEAVVFVRYSATYRLTKVTSGQMLLMRMNLRSQATICTNFFQCCKNDIDFYSSVFSPIVPVTVVDVIPAEPGNLLPLELKDYSRLQTCAVDGCGLPVEKPGYKPSAGVCINSYVRLPPTVTILFSPQITTCFMAAQRTLWTAALL